jgi:alpha-mannosidase
MSMSSSDPEEIITQPIDQLSAPEPASSDSPPDPAGSGPAPEPALLTAMPLLTPELIPEEERVLAEEMVRGPAEAVPDGWVFIALVPHDGCEPPAQIGDQLASEVWCAVSALWHPSLLCRAAGLPRIEPIEYPGAPGPREVRVIPGGVWDQLPSGYRTQAEDAKAALIESGADRDDLIRRIRVRLGAEESPELIEDEGMANAASGFLALGTVHWMLRDLTTAMGHSDNLDHESLTRELLAGAHQWRIGDWSSSVNRLRAAFEVLTQARERFYPVDAYLIDLCLVDPSMCEGVLAAPLESPVPISFLVSAQAIENQALHDPLRMAALRQAIADGWADVVGGSYSEAEDSLLPLESSLWQFRHGTLVYRLHLDDRNVETFGRRRFGLHTQLPQIAKRFGFRYALHVGLDAGRFPIPAETKRMWESPDGSNLESLMRPPMAADRSLAGWLLPWRLAATMKNDHVAAVPLVHWPQPVAPWYSDLRRAGGYSSGLARWTTVNDFFHLTDRPYESFRPEPDLYQTPFLAQAVARGEQTPIGRLSRHHRLRARLDAARAMEAFALAIAAATAGTDTGLHASAGTNTEPGAAADTDTGSSAAAGPAPLREIEALIETGRHDEAATALEKVEPAWSSALAKCLTPDPGHRAAEIASVPATATPDRRPGYLVINPLNIPRRAAVILPDAALDLRPEGPLRAAQFTEHGVYAVVDLPPFGFAWVPREADLGRPPAVAGLLTAKGRRLRNESMEIEIDAATGGIRSVATVGEPMARLGQQLVVTGLLDQQGKPVASQMRSTRFDIDYGGPALLQATAAGTIVDPRRDSSLASFTQRYRLWSGRPILEIEITLADLDASWLERTARADPWSVYLACRWAWPDPSAMLRRTTFWSPEITDAERPETPDAFDISTRNQRTALLFGGLPHHRKHGSRMLDTLLIAGQESTRSFTLGVVLDLEHPFQAAQDAVTPACVVPVDSGPPSVGPTGWLAQVDSKSVAVSHVEFTERTADDRGWGLIFHLIETSGQAARARLRLFRNPTWARQVDFQGETIIDLSIQGDAVQLDLTPHELARVEVAMGTTRSDGSQSESQTGSQSEEFAAD